MVRKSEQTALDMNAPANAPAPAPGSVNGSALAPVADESTGLAAGALDFDFESDGLQETGAEDLRLPIIVWNLKGRDQTTQQMRQLDEFYDTLNEKTYKRLRCVFVHLHKTRLFSRFDNDKNENVIHCSSNDRIIGRLRTKHPDLALEAGVERRCETCPDRDWQRNDKGKNFRNCDDVYGVFAAHLDENYRLGEGFLIRFKRTGLQPFKTHLQKHHLGKRVVNGERTNMPLWAFPVTMRLEIAANGNFATPVIERNVEEKIPRETLILLSEQAKYFAELGEEATNAAEKAEARNEAPEASSTGSGGGTSGVSGSDFAD